MVLDKLFELANPLLKKCSYAENCGNGEIRAGYKNYERCTIYQRRKIVDNRTETMNIKTISRIEKIVE